MRIPDIFETWERKLKPITRRGRPRHHRRWTAGLTGRRQEGPGMGPKHHVHGAANLLNCPIALALTLTLYKDVDGRHRPAAGL